MLVAPRRLTSRTARWAVGTSSLSGMDSDLSSVVPLTSLDLAIRVEGVSHAFPTPNGKPMLALDDVSFDVPRGQFLALVGASGCGKTTILNMAAGLLQPVAGAVTVNGERVMRPSRRTGYMFARDGLLPWRSARSNIEVGLE